MLGVPSLGMAVGSPVHTALGVDVLSQQGAEGKEAWITSHICLGISASVKFLLLFGMAMW